MILAPQSRTAFSLVELSIVLVIVGLLAGGILSGQSLIRAAELRSLTTDSARYQAAVYTFRDKYFALPGDMPNATQFWNVLADDGISAKCQNTEATGKPTCNGNGDGLIASTAVAESERFRAWQHLANAGLVEGSYTGRTDSSTPGSFVTKAGKNVPATKLAGTHMRFVGIPATTGTDDPLLFSGVSAGNYIEVRHDSDAAAAAAPPAPLTAQEAWNIDTKLDDGKPGLGQIFTHKYSSTAYPKCATTDDPATALYNVGDGSKLCVYDIGF